MRRLTGFMFAAAAALALSPGALADNLAGADRLLCSAGRVTACWDSDECYVGSPSELNVPQFIEIDLAARRVSTTKASGESRQTTVPAVRREEGRIVLQGYENGRAFSIVMDEETGDLVASVATRTVGVTVFGACTPVPAK